MRELGTTNQFKIFFWLVLLATAGCCLHAVLQDYKLLTFWFLQCGTRDGFHFSLTFIWSPSCWVGWREQRTAHGKSLLLEKFTSWWNCFVVPVMVALYSCAMLALEIVHTDGEGKEGSFLFIPGFEEYFAWLFILILHMPVNVRRVAWCLSPWCKLICYLAYACTLCTLLVCLQLCESKQGYPLWSLVSVAGDASHWTEFQSIFLA